MKSESAHAVPETIPVLVVGGGPIGSALSIELRLHGIDVLVVERDAEIRLGHPKARSNNMRSLEHYRRWGISDALRAHAWTTRDPQQRLVIAETLLAEPLGAYTLRYGRHAEEARDLAAEPSLSVPQPVTMRILRERSIELGAQWRLGWEAVEIVQDDRSAVVQLRAPDGHLHTVRAAYVVGCDGPGSLVRRAAGIERNGDAPLHRQMSYVVRSEGHKIADLTAGPGYDALGMLAIFNTSASSIISIPDDELWGFGISVHDEREPTRAEIARYGQQLLGAEARIEVVSESSYQVLTRVATRYRTGRLFLAGDAAHVCPPTGGHNMNVGIGDAADLGWKLAAVLHGLGGEALLDSYDAERRPVGERVSRSALDNSRALTAAAQSVAASRPPATVDTPRSRAQRGEALYRLTYAEWNTHGVVLDQRYDTSAWVVPDATSAPDWSETEYWPHARPGHRAPHILLDGDTPLYDRLGPWFTLLDSGAAPEETTRFLETAQRMGMPVTHLAVPQERTQAHYSAPLTLIRPDQHVAWQGHASDDAQAVIRRVLSLSTQHAQLPA